jgi:hypothetical protein
VKYLSGKWVWPALVGAVLLAVGILVLAGHSRVESAGGTGIVELAFTATLQSFNGAPIATQFQSLGLNVTSVRLNTSTDLSLSDAAPGWITIPLPAGQASNLPSQFITTSENFGTSGVLLSAPDSMLQLNLETLQNIPYFATTVSVPAQTYGQIELDLDSAPPGSAVPLCPQAAPAGEGCVTYPAGLASTDGLREQFPNGFPVPVDTVQPMVVNFTIGVGSPPSSDPSSTLVFINPIVVPSANVASPIGSVNPALGIVDGVVTNFDVNTTIVTAEYAGTNQIVASAQLQPDGSFLLNLPAAATPDSTLYDFYVSGNGGYVVRSHVPVSSLGTASGPPPITDLGVLAVPSSTFGSISGTVSDVCSGAAVQGAILQLLVPDTTAPGSASTCDLTGQPPAIPPNCVTVATAVTDDQGSYPLPSAQFTKIAVSPPPGVPYYNLEISASGLNTTLPQVAAGSLFCPSSRFGNSCSFALEHGYLSGAAVLSGPNDTGNRLNDLVVAEDSGTGKIENVTLATISPGAATGGFTISVPDAAPASDAIGVSDFDLFGTVQDLFQGLPQPNSGHLIGTAASVGAPPSACTTIDIPALSPTDCGGLGSVDGTVDNANPNTTSVTLSKDGVQIMETEPNSIGFPPNNSYSFCAPSDSYVLTHYESGVAKSAEPITLAGPQIIGTPCSSICQDSNPKNTCLLCQPLTAPPLE